jgi:Fic family protein
MMTKNQTGFTWRETDINAIFGEVRNLQGKTVGQMNTLGFATKEEATPTTLTLDVIKSSKWAKIAKCSRDTALRDIKDLMVKGILRQEQQGGRSTNYELADF